MARYVYKIKVDDDGFESIVGDNAEGSFRVVEINTTRSGLPEWRVLAGEFGSRFEAEMSALRRGRD
jgi:hypothetical protein